MSEPTACDCGLNLSGIHGKEPKIEVQCYHDGTFGVRAYDTEEFIPLKPGDVAELQWRIRYAANGAPPKMYMVGWDNGDREIQAGDRGGALPDRGSARVGSDTLDTFTARAAGESPDPGLIPDSFQPLIGYRAWLLRPDSDLRSTAQEYLWAPGPNTASCAHNKDGHHVSMELYKLRAEASTLSGSERVAVLAAIDREIMVARRSPERTCTCGFYALLDPKDIRGRVTDTDNLVFGRIEAWGKIAEYSEGFKAEKAKIVTLYRPRGWKARRAVKKAAKKYGVPVEKPPIPLYRKMPGSVVTVVTGFWVGLVAVCVAGYLAFHTPWAIAYMVPAYVFSSIGASILTDFATDQARRKKLR